MREAPPSSCQVALAARLHGKRSLRGQFEIDAAAVSRATDDLTQPRYHGCRDQAQPEPRLLDITGRDTMADDRDQSIDRDDTAGADNRAAAAEAAAVERDDTLVANEAGLDEVTIPASAPIVQPNAIPPDGAGT